MKKIDQNNIPSQESSKIVPYYPGVQADIAQNKQYVGADIQSGSKPIDSNIVSVYSARPTNAIDFAKTFVSYANQQTFTASFIVPGDKVCVLKRIIIDAAISNVGGTITIYGSPSNNLILENQLLNVSIDNIAVPEYNNINVQELVLGTYDTECYILANGGQTITITLNPSIIGFDEYRWVSVKLYGQYLLATGRPLTFEPGILTPLPVYVDKSLT